MVFSKLVKCQQMPELIQHAWFWLAHRKELGMDTNTLLQKQITQANAAYTEYNYTKAKKILKTILDQHPKNIHALTQIANIYAIQGKFQQARTHLEQLIQLEPHNHHHFSNLGLMYSNLYEYKKSMETLSKALELKPDATSALLNIGFTAYQMGDFEKTEQYYKKVFQLNPHWPRAHYNYALLLLTLGRYEEGWKEFELRLESTEWQYLKRNFITPRWRGEDLTNKRLLVYTEQGFGDTIQFARFLSLVKNKSNTIIVEARPEIITLFQQMPTVDETTLQKKALPVFDYHIPLLSIPYVMHCTDELSETIPYIHTNSNKKQLWSNKLAHIQQKKIGICWTGNPNNLLNSHRSFLLNEFLTYLPTKEIQFINLHKNLTDAEKLLLQQNNILDFFDDIHDFSDSAALIENIDLTLTIDTSIAHLCGAMNKPVWVMLSHLPEWRYLLDENKTPWYPSMRLFRQNEIGKWHSVFKKISQELYAWLNLA